MHIYMKFTSVSGPPFVFRDMVCRPTNWLQDILISCFKDRLKNDFYNVCVLKGAPPTLHSWYVLADKVEIGQARNRYCPGVEETAFRKEGVSKAAEPPAMLNRFLQMWSSGSRVQEQMTYQTDHPGPMRKVAKPT